MMKLLEKAKKPSYGETLTKVETDLVMGYLARQKKLMTQQVESSDDDEKSIVLVENEQNEECYHRAINQMVATMNAEKCTVDVNQLKPHDDLWQLLAHDPQINQELIRFLSEYDVVVDKTNLYCPDEDQLEDVLSEITMIKQ